MEMLQGVWKQHLRERAVVGYGVKIFLPSPPNYVTRSPGGVNISKFSVTRVSERFRAKFQTREIVIAHLLLSILYFATRIIVNFCFHLPSLSLARERWGAGRASYEINDLDINTEVRIIARHKRVLYFSETSYRKFRLALWFCQ